MRSYLGLILLIGAAAAANLADKAATEAPATTPRATTTTTPTPTSTPTPTPNPTPTKTTTTTTTTMKQDQRNKRQVVGSNAGMSIPIYYDNFNANPPVEPLQPLKPVQPVAVVTPVVPNSGGLQPPGFLPGFPQNLPGFPQNLQGFPQNLPIVGTLLSNLPLQNLLSLSNMGQLGGLGSLGNFGQLPNFGNLGGTKPGSGVGPAAQTCPLTQKLSCRCEPLISLPVRQPETQQIVHVLNQNTHNEEDGSQELRLELSNGHILYQQRSKDGKEQQGFYALPFASNYYLNIRYSINQTNYTIRAEVDSAAPGVPFEV